MAKQEGRKPQGRAFHGRWPKLNSILPTYSADRSNTALLLLSARNELAEATNLAHRFSSHAGLLAKLAACTSGLRLSLVFVVLRVLACPSVVLRLVVVSIVVLCAHRLSKELKRTESLRGSALVQVDRFSSCERTVQSDSLDSRDNNSYALTSICFHELYSANVTLNYFQ